MAALFIDAYTYSTNATFRNRVQQAAIGVAGTVINEADSVNFHVDRARFAKAFIGNPTAYIATMAQAVCTDATVNGKIAVGGASGTDTDADVQGALTTQWN